MRVYSPIVVQSRIILPTLVESSTFVCQIRIDLREGRREYGNEIIFSMLLKKVPFSFFIFIWKKRRDLRFLIFNSLFIDMIRVYYKLQDF